MKLKLGLKRKINLLCLRDGIVKLNCEGLLKVSHIFEEHGPVVTIEWGKNDFAVSDFRDLFYFDRF